jgi:hyaluronan synthase
MGKTAVRFIGYALRAFAAVYLAALLAAVVVYKAAFFEMVTIDPFFATYGLIVCAFIVSRFVLSLLYRSPKDAGFEPHVAVVMPAFNEEEAIADSIRAILALDYPTEKLEVVVVNDGSSDNTLAEIQAVARENPRVQVIDFPENRGKRAAMAAGIRSTSAERRGGGNWSGPERRGVAPITAPAGEQSDFVIAFVDSDSVLEPDALRKIVQGFADPSVGAVCGHADVLNVNQSWLSRMQAVRYYVAFKVCKAAESVFGAVTCCSGCFAAYRREAIMPHLEAWEHQRFLGRESTYGDDRSLTNHVLRGWRVIYDQHAVSHTIVPTTFRSFMTQQIRWKRSWTRESLRVSRFMWRKHPIASVSTYVGIVLPLVAPVTALRAVTWRPVVEGGAGPFVYLLGIYAMALAYGLYYAVRHSRYDTRWIFGIVFVFFYLAFLLWQTYWAIFTTRKSTWGTRSVSQEPAAPAAAPPAPRPLPELRSARPAAGGGW